MEPILLLLVVLLTSTSALLTSPVPPAPSPVMSLVLPASTSAATAIFVLGDSSVNCGDNSFLSPFLPHNLSSTPLCLGSPRRMFPDFIAEKMGLPPPPLFYSGNWTPPSIASGINFGSTAATILSDTGGGTFLFQTLTQQVRQVYETLQFLNLQAGPAAPRRAASSLFLLSFGRDDYAGIFSGGAAWNRPMYGRRGLSRLLVSQMIQAVKDLYNAGARRIAVVGVGPLGCAPRVRWESAHVPQVGLCVEEANEMVGGYNARLAARLKEVEPELPGSRIAFCDVYMGTMEILSNPRIYGFENTRDACCGGGSFGGMIGCLVKDMICSEPSRYVWWDLYGATETVDSLLANWSWSPLRPEHHICAPIGLQQLASA